MLNPEVLKILQFTKVIINIWSVYFSLFFLTKGYSTYKVHLLSFYNVFVGSFILSEIKFMRIDLNSYRVILFTFLSIILIISVGRQIFLYYKYQYIANITKILTKFAQKYNVSNFNVTGNFEFKDIVEKANFVFKDTSSSTSEKFAAVRVLARIAKLTQLTDKHNKLAGKKLNKN